MLSEDAVREIEAARSEEESLRHALLTALRVVQRERRQVGSAEIAYIADLLDLSPAVVQGVARFYDQITQTPTGQHVLSLCRGISCYLCGADDVAAEVMEVLAVGRGGTTADGQFTLRLVECIGDCDHAPAAMVDDRFIGPVEGGAIRALTRAEGGSAWHRS